MILSRTDPYGLRGAVKPGRLPETPAPPATRDKPENVRRCASCDVPPERCRGKCRSDADQERARAGGDGRKKVDAEALVLHWKIVCTLLFLKRAVSFFFLES